MYTTKNIIVYNFITEIQRDTHYLYDVYIQVLPLGKTCIYRIVIVLVIIYFVLHKTHLITFYYFIINLLI